MDDNYQNLTDAEKKLRTIEELKFQLENINFNDENNAKINQCMDLNTPYLTYLVKEAEENFNINVPKNSPNNKRKLSLEEREELSTSKKK